MHCLCWAAACSLLSFTTGSCWETRMIDWLFAYWVFVTAMIVTIAIVKSVLNTGWENKND
jgi:membrane protein DedA with SNARE-associated domain